MEVDEEASSDNSTMIPRSSTQTETTALEAPQLTYLALEQPGEIPRALPTATRFRLVKTEFPLMAKEGKKTSVIRDEDPEVVCLRLHRPA